MTGASRQLRATVADTLAKCGATVHRATPACWEFQLANGKRLDVEARLEDEWLVLRAPLTAEDRLAPWDVLLANRGLPAWSKLALLGTPPAMCAGAELPLADEIDLPQRLATACAALLQAGRALAAGADAGDDTVPIALEPESKDDALEHLPREAGWPVTRRADGRVIVDLETTAGFHQAILGAAGDSVRLSTELVARDDLAPPCRQALGALLLTASERLRLVRGAAQQRKRRCTAGLEVALGAAPTATEIDLALGALALACEQFGREARFLAEEPLAREYVTYTGIGGDLCD
jgi:hypothetical protein